MFFYLKIKPQYNGLAPSWSVRHATVLTVCSGLDKRISIPTLISIFLQSWIRYSLLQLVHLRPVSWNQKKVKYYLKIISKSLVFLCSSKTKEKGQTCKTENERKRSRRSVPDQTSGSGVTGTGCKKKKDVNFFCRFWDTAEKRDRKGRKEGRKGRKERKKDVSPQ